MTHQAPQQYYSLLQLQELLRDLIAACPMSQNVWIVAELSDVRESGGHCYMELLQKDPQTGQNVAKARASIWANSWRKIRAEFLNATGQEFKTGLKVMVLVSASYHPVYGMNLTITAVNTSYTLGERERRRREILAQLEKDGIYDLNKQLDFPRPCQRIAVITSATAAGYGDFRNQLLLNTHKLRFDVKLFGAIVQGSQTAQSVIQQLNIIAQEQDKWDCVCIIRGGGASTDLDGFDDYELASHVAQFPLPVIVGIGHERDTTVLDYIACQRVKTPTAAAEFLIGLGESELAELQTLGSDVLKTVQEIIGGARQQLAYLSGSLPMAPIAALQRATKQLDNATLVLSRISTNKITPLQSRLAQLSEALKNIATNAVSRASMKLDSQKALIEALSPQATLRRGYSVTRVNGAAITNATNINPGDVITTELANGSITSIVK